MVRGGATGDALVGRAAALAAVSAALDHDAPAPRAVLVTGDPGFGKTATLHAATEQASSLGQTVLSACGSSTETDLPYAVLHQLCRTLLGGVEGLPPRQRGSVLRAFGLADEGGEPDRRMLSLGVLGLMCEGASASGLLVAVDDAHWADAESLEVLDFVGRRLEGDRLCIMVACRAATVPDTWRCCPSPAPSPRSSNQPHRLSPQEDRNERQRNTSRLRPWSLAACHVLGALGRAVRLAGL